MRAVAPAADPGRFRRGTKIGIKRVAAANDRYGYDELLYVRKTYFSPEALRNANGAVVNNLLSIRNPQFWGEGASSCALDGTRFEKLAAEPDERSGGPATKDTA